MMKHYTKYTWKEGIPYGIQKVDADHPLSYKILSDPYHKWISIEEYSNGSFKKVIYDSKLFDFRQLKPINQTAWNKVQVMESETEILCEIRDQDDRLILFEHYHFEKGTCRECQTLSVHKIPVSYQKVFYKRFGDTFNGVVLFDCNDQIVMQKEYAIEEESGEFMEVLKESWNGQDFLLPK